MKKNEISYRTFSDDGLMEGICSGWGHEPCNAGTDFRKAWIYEKSYMLSRAVAEIRLIISATEKRIPVNPDKAQNCRSRVCGGCIDFPKQIHFDSRRIFSFYCPEYNIENLCSFRAISYYCGNLRKFLLHLNIDEIDVDFLMEVEGICQEIYKKTFMLAGVHNKAVAKKAQYINGPGAASKESGEWTLKKAREVLDKNCGGIKGYMSLPRGEKKFVREAIEKAIKAKDIRNVDNILNKLKYFPIEEKKKAEIL